ncbi:MAG: signal recognition particle-docking protein FtsY [Flavobacteriaceae bacterium]|jgi:fused signal recognition particle receptor|nr:signal recognition particle-docking protein FtsY [Flavobacteriaceae bacterium]
MGWFDAFKKKQEPEKLAEGLEKTKKSLFSKIAVAVAGRSTVDADTLDALEEQLIASDVGVHTTLKIIERIEERVAQDKYLGADDLQRLLKEEIKGLLSDAGQHHFKATQGPYVVLVVGVNGVGKTTTIGKLAHQLTQEGKKVMVGAADTFRAAAVDQLQVWADRAKVPLVRMQEGADPASVAYESVVRAVKEEVDVLFVDTAGRLHNKVNLMNELSKIKRVMGKVLDGSPHEVMLVLDGSTGQNAFEQARQFTAATEVNSLTVTKLDGSAKGGVVLGISDQFTIPVRFIGLGEGIEDLRVFDKEAFVDALFEE